MRAPDVSLSDIELRSTRNGDLIENWAEATINGRRIRGQGGNRAEALGALMYAAMTNVDDVLAANGRIETLSRTKETRDA